MDPLIRIIKYLFKKKNIDNKYESISSFFSNGQSFPQFISLIFDINSIPGIKNNPSSLFQRRINNTSTLQFLFQKNQKIKAINPSCENEKDQKDLLRLILTMRCYTSNLTTIINKSNSIVEKSGIHILKKSELINLKFLSLLINILTDGEFPVSENLLEITQNCDNMKDQIPIFINKDSLKEQNSFIFLIQIQVIFEIFSNKIEQIVTKDSSNGNQPTVAENNTKDVDNKEKSTIIQNKSNISNNHESNTDKKENLNSDNATVKKSTFQE